MNHFIGFHDWLLTFGGHGDVLEITTNTILQSLVQNCSLENEALVEICLEFFVVRNEESSSSLTSVPVSQLPCCLVFQ